MRALWLIAWLCDVSRLIAQSNLALLMMLKPLSRGQRSSVFSTEPVKHGDKNLTSSFEASTPQCHVRAAKLHDICSVCIFYKKIYMYIKLLDSSDNDLDVTQAHACFVAYRLAL